MLINKKLPGLIGLILASQAMPAHSQSSVTFTDIAKDGETGIDYSRAPSPRVSIIEEIQQRGFFFPQDAVNNPLKSHGAPGTALFDFDNDGDLDIYVTNGPGKSNSLFKNQMKETGNISFVDVASESGVSLTNLDSTGVCYGDIDNDGDKDLMVLSTSGGNTLFENKHGMFTDISGKSGFDETGLNSTSCSMGDVNNDGLLDVAIANTYDDWTNYGPILDFSQEFRNQDNQLYINVGGNRYIDKSEESGITNYQGITWAISLVDYDLDGDVDLIAADDQGAKPGEIRGGFDTGYVRIYNNDGTGKFTDLTVESKTNRFGAWMGLSFGDYNSDGYMDIFASNIGGYMARFMIGAVPFEVVESDWDSGWFLGSEDKTFTFPGVGDLKSTTFGWGNLSFDYDNDADTDVVYHGGIDMGSFIDASNPGSVLNNDGDANFNLDTQALMGSTNHSRRLVMGVATGDLNNDGFSDIVSVSAANWPDQFPLIPMSIEPFGSAYDSTAATWPTFIPNDPLDMSKGLSWTQMPVSEGTLSVELNSANNNNNWVKVKVIGSVNLTEKGMVNRDGIGAVMTFTPKGGKPVMHPVTGGSSYASQNDLAVIFGLSNAKKGALEITWPGGVKNKLYNVKAGKALMIPEVPCSYTDMTISSREYYECVVTSLSDLKDAGVISKKQSYRMMSSALKAFKKHKNMMKG